MYVWTEETRNLMDEVRDYLDDDGEVVPEAPEGTKEKWEQIKKLLDEETERQIQMMCQ